MKPGTVLLMQNVDTNPPEGDTKPPGHIVTAKWRHIYFAAVPSLNSSYDKDLPEGFGYDPASKLLIRYLIKFYEKIIIWQLFLKI